MKRIVVVLAASLMFAFTASAASARAHTARIILRSVGQSGVMGRATLVQRSGDDETAITVRAFGLTPGVEYISLYYENHECTLEDDSLEEDVIGAPYRGHMGGRGGTRGSADHPLEELDSISIRRASDTALLACGDVHPGG